MSSDLITWRVQQWQKIVCNDFFGENTWPGNNELSLGKGKPFDIIWPKFSRTSATKYVSHISNLQHCWTFFPKVRFLSLIPPFNDRTLISWGPINPYGIGLMSLSPMEIMGLWSPSPSPWLVSGQLWKLHENHRGHDAFHQRVPDWQPSQSLGKPLVAPAGRWNHVLSTWKFEVYCLERVTANKTQPPVVLQSFM